MRKLREKTVVLAATGICAVMFLTGCGSTELAEAFDEAEVETQAETVIADINAGDYEAVEAMYDATMEAALPAGTLEESIGGMVEEAGEFTEIKNTAVIGQKVKDTEEDLAVAVVVAEYSEKKLTYTISFDTDMKLAGFYVK